MNLHTANNKFQETNNNFIAPDGSGGGGTITVDTALSASSTNPVQNKAVYAAIQELNSAISGVDTLIGSGVIE